MYAENIRGIRILLLDLGQRHLQNGIGHFKANVMREVLAGERMAGGYFALDDLLQVLHASGFEAAELICCSGGVWEIFIPGVGEGSLYKFELRDIHGNIVLKTDPFGFFYESAPKTAAIVWNNQKFPDPSPMIQQLGADHYQVNLWEHAFTNPASPIHKPLEPHSGDYLVWDATMPHDAQCIGSDPAVTLIIGHSPHGPDSGADLAPTWRTVPGA